MQLQQDNEEALSYIAVLIFTRAVVDATGRNDLFSTRVTKKNATPVEMWLCVHIWCQGDPEKHQLREQE